MAAAYCIGVDVGSASVRAGVVSCGDGTVVSQAQRDISIRKSSGGHVEQSTAEIWEAVCATVREAVASSGVDPSAVKGLGFDATCSMAVTAKDAATGVSVAADGEAGWDIVMWMDHRAAKQTVEVNATGHPVLQYVGGGVSPEMAIPKLKWLRENKPASWWAGVDKIYELPDWLVKRATGSERRSLCSTVCKWNYVNDASFSGWDLSYMEEIGCDAEVVAKIGDSVAEIGDACGVLTEEAKAALGLQVAGDVVVPASLIDAHAGGLALSTGGETKVVVIAGTSACFMAVSPEKRVIPGVWGPYKGAMLPGVWLHEGGMSAMGAFLDSVVGGHPAKAEAERRANEADEPLYAYLEGVCAGEGSVLARVAAAELHYYPDVLGNRSPVGDSTLKGMVTGLVLDETVENLALALCAAMMAVAYGIQHVADALREGGYRKLEAFVICGGLARSNVFCDTLAGVSQREVHVCPGGDAMLVGGAICAAAASGVHGSLEAAQGAMSPPPQRVVSGRACDAAHTATHRARYAVYREMLRDQQKYRKMMEATAGL